MMSFRFKPSAMARPGATDGAARREPRGSLSRHLVPATLVACLVSTLGLSPRTEAAVASFAQEPIRVAEAAPTAASSGTWAEAESAHFSLFTDAGTEVATEGASNLERLRETLLEIAPQGRFDARSPFRVYLFRDPRDVSRVAPGGGSDFGGSAGFVVPHAHGIYGAAVWAEGGGEASRFLYKQYLLWVLHANMPQLPRWLRQGMAEYYSTFRIENGEALLGLPVEEYVSYLRHHAQVLTSASPGTARPMEEERFGVQIRAWALVHYLLLGSEESREQMRTYVRTVVAGTPPEVAFQNVFGVGRTEMETRLPDYFARKTLRYQRLSLSAVPIPEVKTTTMSAAETEFRLGDLLAHVRPQDPEAARTHLRRALELDPEQGLAYADLGWLAAETGDLAAAVPAFRRAAELQPDDTLVQYLLGDGLLRSLGRRRPQSEDELAVLHEAESALRRATEINPGFPAAWERLGYALNLEPDAGAEAVAALERAVDLSPARDDLVLNLLLAYARSGDVEAADRLLNQLAARGADEATLARARELRLRLALQEANALLRADEMDDAVAVLARVRAETEDPALAELADAQLHQVLRARAHNRFAELYQEAARRVAAGDPEAEEALEAVRQVARPGRQQEAVADLAERWEEEQP